MNFYIALRREIDELPYIRDLGTAQSSPDSIHFLEVMALLHANAMHPAYGMINYHVQQLFPQTAEGQFLDNLLTWRPLSRLVPKRSVGRATARGTVGSHASTRDGLAFIADMMDYKITLEPLAEGVMGAPAYKPQKADLKSSHILNCGTSYKVACVRCEIACALGKYFGIGIRIYILPAAIGIKKSFLFQINISSFDI